MVKHFRESEGALNWGLKSLERVAKIQNVWHRDLILRLKCGIGYLLRGSSW